MNDDGTLTYSFVESVEAMHPFYVIRLLGGVLFFAGMVVMAWNLWKTVRGARSRKTPRSPPRPIEEDGPTLSTQSTRPGRLVRRRFRHRDARVGAGRGAPHRIIRTHGEGESGVDSPQAHEA